MAMNTQAILNILWKLAPLCSRKEIEDATEQILTTLEGESGIEIALRMIDDCIDRHPNTSPLNMSVSYLRRNIEIGGET